MHNDNLCTLWSPATRRANHRASRAKTSCTPRARASRGGRAGRRALDLIAVYAMLCGRCSSVCRHSQKVRLPLAERGRLCEGRDPASHWARHALEYLRRRAPWRAQCVCGKRRCSAAVRRAASSALMPVLCRGARVWGGVGVRAAPQPAVTEPHRASALAAALMSAAHFGAEGLSEGRRGVVSRRGACACGRRGSQVRSSSWALVPLQGSRVAVARVAASVPCSSVGGRKKTPSRLVVVARRVGQGGFESVPRAPDRALCHMVRSTPSGFGALGRARRRICPTLWAEGGVRREHADNRPGEGACEAPINPALLEVELGERPASAHP